MLYLHQHRLLLPRRQMSGPEQGQVVWRTPTPSAMYAIVSNPAYAGAFAYGRPPMDSTWRPTDQAVRPRRIYKPLEEWAVVQQNVYPAYISGDTYLANLSQLRRHRPQFGTTTTAAQGISRPGTALRQGLVVCGHCGHRMQSIHKPDPRYICQSLAQRFDQASCIFLDARPIDEAVFKPSSKPFNPLS